MSYDNGTKGGSDFDSPGTGKGPTSSQSPLSERRGSADPTPLGGGSIGNNNPTNSSGKDQGHSS